MMGMEAGQNRGSARAWAPDGAAAGVSSTPAASAGHSPAGDAPPALFLPRRSTIVSYEHARDWGVRHGLAQARRALDLRRVNARRQAMGLAPFAVRQEA